MQGDRGVRPLAFLVRHYFQRNRGAGHSRAAAESGCRVLYVTRKEAEYWERDRALKHRNGAPPLKFLTVQDLAGPAGDMLREPLILDNHVVLEMCTEYGQLYGEHEDLKIAHAYAIKDGARLKVELDVAMEEVKLLRAKLEAGNPTTPPGVDPA